MDSFAALAYLGGEPGMARVQANLGDATRHRCRVAMSVINLGEVLTITEREVGLVGAQAALAAIEQLPIGIVPATRETALAAAHVKANFRLLRRRICGGGALGIGWDRSDGRSGV